MSVETRSNWGAGFIAGLGAQLMEMENQADMAYSLASPDALGLAGAKMTAVFKDKSTQKARETINGKTPIGKSTKTNEGQDYFLTDRQPTYETQLNPVKFTNGLEITIEDRDDRDANIAEKMDEAKDMKISYMQDINERGWSIFNYAFTAQASLPAHLSFYGDGVPMSSGSHPIKDSITSTTTQSNTATVVYSETNQETGIQAIENQLNDRGRPGKWGNGELTLLVPLALRKTAIIVNKSTKRSGTANNDMNIYDGIITVIASKWLSSQGDGGSNTAWHLVDSTNSPIINLTREGYTPDTWVDRRNKNVVYDARARYIVGNKEWKGTWSSTGAG